MSDTDIDFMIFMNEVDSELNNLCEMTHEDLPDFCYRDYFEQGISPKKTAIEAMDLWEI